MEALEAAFPGRIGPAIRENVSLARLQPTGAGHPLRAPLERRSGLPQRGRVDSAHRPRRLSGPFPKYGQAPRALGRRACKARGARMPGLYSTDEQRSRRDATALECERTWERDH